MLNMRFSESQVDLLAKYLSDISKILFASTVVGFFLPTAAGEITIPVFVLGSIVTATSLAFSIRLAR